MVGLIVTTLVVGAVAAVYAAWKFSGSLGQSSPRDPYNDMPPVDFWTRRPATELRPVVGEVAVWCIGVAPDTYEDTMTRAGRRFALAPGPTTIGSNPAADELAEALDDR